MTGRGVDQIFPRACAPHLYEPYVQSALEYVELAERATGPIPRGVDPSWVWGDALATLDEARPDARIVNLETAVTTSEDAAPKLIDYRMHPANVPLLAAARLDCCVLANNHVLDWGTAGLLETLDCLARAGVRAAGAGRDLHEAWAPATIELGGGRRVLVFSFGARDSGIPRRWAAGHDRPGVHLLPDLSDAAVARVAALVAATRRGAGDAVVASVHWGPNWGFDVPPSHRRFAHALVDDAGVDVVHGHSSHHAMAIEVYRGRPILYGCGDFLNDYEGIGGHEEYRDDLVLAYLPTLDARTGALLELTMAPFRIRHFSLHWPSDAERAWLRDTLDRECRRFGHHVSLRGDALVLEWE
jgi:poly-gamma-glutamate synthesis protein (capsule biosynthesis protein)